MVDESRPDEADAGIVFAFEYTVRGMILHKLEPMRFKVHRPAPMIVVFARKGLQQIEATDGHFFLRVLARRRPSVSTIIFLQQLLDQESHPERPWSAGFKADIQGKIRGSYYSEPSGGPENYEQFVMQLHQELFDAAAILSLARWRVDAHGTHQPILELCKGFFSRDAKTFFPLPLPGRCFREFHRELCVSDEQKAEIIAYYEQGVREPFAHRLFREAWAERLSSPRSALIAGVAALEIGVKEAIADLVPDAEWLVLNLPSPDVVKILREGLGHFPTRLKLGGQVVAPPKEMLDEINKAVGMRNRLAHAGQGKVRRETVHDLLCTIRDVLCLLDYYRGYQWALCHMSDATLQKLPGVDLVEVQDRTRSEDALHPPTAVVAMQLSDLPDRID
ncbi:MAG: hypothetical protein U1F70_07995 [Candidatus Competibacteraceae bacterium]